MDSKTDPNTASAAPQRSYTLQLTHAQRIALAKRLVMIYEDASASSMTRIDVVDAIAVLEVLLESHTNDRIPRFFRDSTLSLRL